MQTPADKMRLQRGLFDLAMRSQYWPMDQLVAYQRTLLAKLVDHARRTVPFYKGRLDAIMTRVGRIDWARWGDIPIISRQDLIEGFEALQSLRHPPEHGRVWLMSSSGSTGQPVRVNYNALFAATNEPFNWRSETWQGLDWTGTSVTRAEDYNLDTDPPRWSRTWGPPWLAAAQAGRIVDLGRSTSTEVALRFLQQLGPGYLTTGPNSLHMYAMEARRLGIDLRLRAGLGQGEGVTPAARIAVREVFEAPLFERYSSREAGRMAHECAHQKGMHQNMEKVLVEILDEQGRPCPQGVEGRVVVTPLYNTINPLIRYEQGDMAYWGPPCTCGRTLPIIAKITGRTSAIFRHPDGRATHRFYTQEARDALRCGIWQIAQVGPLDFEVRYVPNDWDVPADEDTARAIFLDTYFPDARVEFKRLRTLRATPADKYLEYVYDVKKPAAAG
jgi:phenylacetate-CoA ligase